MLIRLKNSGAFEAEEIRDLKEIPASLEKRARFVYAGTFMSMDGEVEVTKEQLTKLVGSYNTRMAKLKRLANGGPKLGRPVQLDHTRSARDTVGRVTGDLSIEDYELEDGTTVSAVYGTLKILGRENVERVLDGRWTELSIGADFENSDLSEVSITPFPAASDASLLAQKRLGMNWNSSLDFTYKGKQWEIGQHTDDETYFNVQSGSIRIEFYKNYERGLGISAQKGEIQAAAKAAIDKKRFSSLSRETCKIVKVTSDGYVVEGTTSGERETMMDDEIHRLSKLSRDSIGRTVTHKDHKIEVFIGEGDQYLVTITKPDGSTYEGRALSQTPDIAISKAKQAIDSKNYNRLSRLAMYRVDRWKEGDAEIFIECDSDDGAFIEVGGKTHHWKKPPSKTASEPTRAQVVDWLKKKGVKLSAKRLADDTVKYKDHIIQVYEEGIKAPFKYTIVIVDWKTGRQVDEKNGLASEASAVAEGKKIIDSMKLSEGEDEDMNRAKLKKYLTEEKKLSDADAEKELNRLEKAEDKADLKKLSDEADEHEKKLAGEEKEDEEKLAEGDEEEKKELASSEPWGLRWEEAGNNAGGPVKVKQKDFKTEEARDKFVDDLMERDYFIRILAYSDPRKLSEGEEEEDKKELAEGEEDEKHLVGGTKIKSERYKNHTIEIYRTGKEYFNYVVNDSEGEVDADTGMPSEADAIKAAKWSIDQQTKNLAKQAAKTVKLTAARDQLKRLSTDFRAKADSANLALRSSKIMHRLSSLRSSGKVTPAEIKKMNLTELAGKSDEAVEAVLKSYEQRQPVILVGVFGSMKAMSHGQLESLSKKKRLRQLESESRKNMSSVPPKDEEETEEKLSEPMIHMDTEKDTGVDLAALEGEYNVVCSMIDEGKIDDVKARLKSWLGRMGASGSFAVPEPTIHDESGAQLSSLAADIAQLQAKFDEALGLAKSLAS